MFGACESRDRKLRRRRFESFAAMKYCIAETAKDKTTFKKLSRLWPDRKQARRIEGCRSRDQMEGGELRDDHDWLNFNVVGGIPT
jgi:hypothetical protein